MEEPQEPKKRRVEFDDALKGFYQDHDEVRPEQEIDYRSLTAESVGSLILGILSSLMLIHWVFAIFPILGIILGVLAILKILNAHEELGGFGISTAGVALSVIFLIVGACTQYYVDSFATPAGYVDLTFDELAADPKTGRIPENILKLAETQQRVFIEGHMFPTRKMTEIESFVLVPDLEQSKFGSPTRKPTEMIEVRLSSGAGISFRTLPIRVGGILSVNEKGGEELPYRIEADVVR